MIQNKTKNEVYTSKSKESAEFGVVWNEKAFTILSDSLYTNKIRAVCREYMTNAYDAHVEAGITDTPFEINVPTRLEPFFSVRDFGFGLNHDNVKKVFATFFMSTKENSNEANGCLGLGSKSGFAVGDQFTVESVFEGTKSVYLCYKDKQGRPTIDLKQQLPTQEKSGLRIVVPANLNDLGTWQEECGYVSATYSITPTIFGDTLKFQESYNRTKIFVDKLYSDGDYVALNGSGKCKVLMGNVVYDVDNISTLLPKALQNLYETFKTHINIFVKFNLGEVNIAPSREYLSLDAYTKRVLSKSLSKTLIKEYRKYVGSKDFDVSNYYKLYKKFRDTTMWGFIRDMKLPFVGSDFIVPVYRYEQTSYTSTPQKIRPFSSSMKGLLKSQQRCYEHTMRGSLENLNQLTFCNWDVEKLIVAHGEVRALKRTLENILKEFGGDHELQVLYASSEKDALFIKNYFGVKDENYVAAQDYYVEVKRKKSYRTGFGKQAQDTIVTAPFNVTTGEKDNRQPVLLTQEVCYADNELNITAPNGKYKTNVSRHYVVEILRLYGITTVVPDNSLTHNKLVKNNIKPVEFYLKRYINANKVNIIKHDVWSRNGFDVYDRHKLLEFIPNKVKEYAKLQNFETKYEGTYLLSSSDAGLKETKLYKQEQARKTNYENVVETKLATIAEKLPLLSSLHSDKDKKYYLKLEGVLK